MDQKNKNEKNGLFIPNRQVAAYVSLAISLLCVVFMAGYFFGKKQIVEQFVVKAEQDSFADQIYASLCTLYDQDAEPLETMVQTDGMFSTMHEEMQEKVDSTRIPLEKSEEPIGDSDLINPSPRYYAQLIGYGTKKAADSFVQKLQNQYTPVLVKSRKSKTAQGRTITWYQVVTKPFSDRDALESLTQHIAHDEKIKGVQIFSC